MIAFSRSHNGGPPLDDEHLPEWGRGGVGGYFHWKKAHRAFWRHVPHEIMVRRAARAEALGLTYEEYTLEILLRGRYLQPYDTARIRAIQAARPAG